MTQFLQADPDDEVADPIPVEPSGCQLRSRLRVRLLMQRTADQIFASLGDERRRQDRAEAARKPGAPQLHPRSPVPA